MSTTIYYFSATGNSLTTARLLAERLDNCRLIPATAAGKEPKIIDDSDCVGFVFPVYYGDMPYPMRRLIGKLVLKSEAYVFAVATCRGHTGDAAKRLDLLMRTRGQKLSLFQSIPMPGNSFLNEMEVDNEHLAKQKERIAPLIDPILGKKYEDYFTTDVLKLQPVSYPNNFRAIMADDTCIGCGTCAAVCPMDNIVLCNSKAFIGDQCATCLACFHWCPVEAIYMSKQEGIERRRKYRHPDVVLEDILDQKTLR